VGAFSLRKIAWPLNLGQQQQAIGAGGPSGFPNATAGHSTPWPYITGTRRFIQGYPYGAASTLLATQFQTNYWTGGPQPYLLQGYVKPQTFTESSY
jgi:hypothetical protein